MFSPLVALVSFLLVAPSKGLPPPPGGIGTGPDTIPIYSLPNDTNTFDWQSLALALHQEYIELDLFRFSLDFFSDDDWEEAGLGEADRGLIAFMADQEIGHAKAISNMLGPQAPLPCEYSYNFTTVAEFIDFSQRLTRWGESGVYGFLEHLDNRAAAQILLQSITTEARQQMIFRQFEGLFPMPVWFEVGITQSMAWTMLAPWIVSCPPENSHLMWQNFPSLYLLDEPTEYMTSEYPPAISHNRTLSEAGKQINLAWDAPGMIVGPDENGTYVTSTNVNSTDGELFVAWTHQLNITFTSLNMTANNTGFTYQPSTPVFNDTEILDPIVNGSVFIAIVDSVAPTLGLTPFNVSLLNDHIVAGPTVYVAG